MSKVSKWLQQNKQFCGLYNTLKYLEHLIREKGKQKLLMEGKIEGTRRRGKQRTWTSDVTDWCSPSYTKCVRMAESRKEWSSMAADLLRRRWHPQ